MDQVKKQHRSADLHTPTVDSVFTGPLHNINCCYVIQCGSDNASNVITRSLESGGTGSSHLKQFNDIQEKILSSDRLREMQCLGNSVQEIHIGNSPFPSCSLPRFQSES